MTSEQNIDSIFGAAVEITSDEERDLFLQEACGGNVELRDRVERLLRAHAAAGGFLPEQGDRTIDASLTSEGPGSQIGPYKLRERLGEGGMGVVWAAEQSTPIRRKVALKVIKPGMDTDAVVARFEAERQALALMEHPNIARVFDAGTTEHGRPYFVMELIRGVPITQYCDENRLTVHQRLALFVEVCQAVQHAHQKGIIHRDVKPSNVLVTLHDGTPVPKIIDFGIAKALSQQLTEKTIYTRVHQAIGTLAYMSPEAAELSGLDMDTRADVYGLGVLLYELLTGTTPFDRKRLEEAALHEACRIIREEEPPKASTRLSSLGETATALSAQRNTYPRDLVQLVHGDLDWILVKALEKDRTRRYESASAFAADVRRHLNNEPIDARPPSNWYRLRKYSRRHRSLVAGVSALLVILIVSSVVATSGWIDAERERQKADTRLYDLRTTLFEQGVDHILAANIKEAIRVKDRLQELGACDLAVKLQAILWEHTQEYDKATALLEKAVEDKPDDAGLLALLANAHGMDDMINWWENIEHLRSMDHDGMTPVERVYAAMAFVIDPDYGYKLANEAVTQRPGSPIARLTRGRLLAERALRGRHPELTDKAVEDVDSVRWLLGTDEKFPAMAITAYVSAGNASRAANEPNWNRHFGAVRDVVAHIENKGPLYWEMIPLANYYHSLDQQDKALPLYRNAAKNLQNDFLVNHYLALTVELDEQPDAEIMARFQRGELKTYGLGGFGCLQATKGNVHQAVETAYQIVDQYPRSAESLAEAAFVLRLAGRSDEAERLVRERIESVSETSSSPALQWVRDSLLPYYAENWDDQKLIDRSEKSSYSGACLSGAYCTIGLKRLAVNDIEGARENFRKCVEQRIYFLHAHAWSCALLKWIERRNGGSDGARLGG